MAKASVERSSGADWYLVSKTPLTGAKTMSQKMRVNCGRRAMSYGVV